MGERDFFRKVWCAVAQIPEGKVATYGQIAHYLGNPKAARTVGWAVSSTPANMNIPCHRVVSRNGDLAPAEVFGGVGAQRFLLETEGVRFTPDGKVDLARCQWLFPGGHERQEA